MVKLKEGIMKLTHERKHVADLHAEFKENTENIKYNPVKLKFIGVDGFDVYNITAPFECGVKQIIAGRVEKRDSEHSKVMFFELKNSVCTLIKDAQVFELQDPSVSKIGDEIVLSGVEIFDHPTLIGCLWWRTVFFRGKDIYSLKRFGEGPNGMKDIRLIDIGDKIGIFSRPQHPEGKVDSLGGRGTIGYSEVEKLEDLNADIINKAILLENQLFSEEWLGANEIHVLRNRLLGVLGHVAMYDENRDRHYYPAVFAFDSENKTYSNLKIVADRAMFLDGPCKKADLHDVVFSGGIRKKEDNKAVLYVGTGDVESQYIKIENPFCEYELL
jgi:hypothetical protein